MRPKVLALAAGACVLGLTLGLWAKPQLGLGEEPALPMAAGPDIQIVVEPGKPPPEVVTTDRLEVLAPDMIEAAEASRRAVVEASRTDDQPWYEPRWMELRIPRRQSRPSFDCRDAQSLGEEAVCADPTLAAADRRLERAFRRAVEAGVPYAQLRAEQDDWLSVREAAARRSPRAVASIYDQRIRELDAMADGDWEG